MSRLRACDVVIGEIYRTMVGGRIGARRAGVPVLARVVRAIPADARSRNVRFEMIDLDGNPLLKPKRAADLQRVPRPVLRPETARQ